MGLVGLVGLLLTYYIYTNTFAAESYSENVSTEDNALRDVTLEFNRAESIFTVQQSYPRLTESNELIFRDFDIEAINEFLGIDMRLTGLKSSHTNGSFLNIWLRTPELYEQLDSFYTIQIGHEFHSTTHAWNFEAPAVVTNVHGTSVTAFYVDTNDPTMPGFAQAYFYLDGHPFNVMLYNPSVAMAKEGLAQLVNALISSPPNFSILSDGM